MSHPGLKTQNVVRIYRLPPFPVLDLTVLNSTELRIWNIGICSKRCPCYDPLPNVYTYNVSASMSMFFHLMSKTKTILFFEIVECKTYIYRNLRETL